MAPQSARKSMSCELSRVIPSVYTYSGYMWRPNANDAKIQILRQASVPSISAAGLLSGATELLRCFRVSSKGRVVASILVNIICRTVENAGNAVQLICGKALVHGRIIGMPPPTLASNRNFTPFLRRQLKSCAPRVHNEPACLRSQRSCPPKLRG